MIKGLTYVIVTTDDMAKSRRFFTEQLGLSTDMEMGDAFAQFTTRDGTMWAFMQRPPHVAPGAIDLYLRVDDVDAAYTAWRQRGVETVTAPHDEEFGRTFAFKDPDGRVLHAYAEKAA